MNRTTELILSGKIVFESGKSGDALLKDLEAAAAAGIEAAEIDFFAAGADFAEASRIFGKDMIIGAGGIADADAAYSAASAGAKFISTSLPKEQIFEAMRGLGIPVFAVALTQREIFSAAALGAEIIKIAPCAALGPAFFASLPSARFLLSPAEGLTLENIEKYSAPCYFISETEKLGEIVRIIRR